LLAAGSGLDATFDSDGKRAVEIDGFDVAGPVVVQPWDGKVVVLNNGDTGAQLVRFNANGSMDGAPVDLGALGFDFAVDVAVSTGNKLVVVGDNNANGGDVQVARFDSALNLDFSVNIVLASGEVTSGVEVRGDGSIVIGGSSNDDMFVMQLTSSGTLDNGFGSGGVRTITFVDPAQATSLALQPDGMALIAGKYNDSGSTTENFAIARVDTAGNLDNGFDLDGVLAVPDTGSMPETFTGVAADVTGDIYAIGSINGVGVLTEISASGVLNLGYDTINNDPFVEVLGAEQGAFSVALDASGKLLITGQSNSFNFSLSRYTTSGAPDNTFDGDGNVQTVIGITSQGVGLAQYGDGRIVVAGSAAVAGPTDFDLAIARYGSAPVSNTPPTPNSIGTPTAVVRQNAATFTGSFTDPDLGDTHQITWNFGDGSPVVTGTLSPSHTYAATGPYVVTFTVSDGVNPAQSTMTNVTVTAAGVVAGNLLVGGTGGADAVIVTRNTSGIFVQDGVATFGPFSPTGQIRITLGDGNDQLNVASSMNVSMFVDAGAGNDTIKGGGGNDILLGGPGNDRLMGAAGRDLLIGGTGADRILGDQDDDIMISGTTAHDANAAALQAIASEWTSTRSYLERVANIQNGTGSMARNNGSFFFAIGSTLFDDGAADSLTGNAGTDWFILSANDVITNVQSSEFGPTIV